MSGYARGRNESGRCQGKLVQKPLPMEMMKPAPFFRMMQKHKPAFLIDEVGSFLKKDSDLISALNNGVAPPFCGRNPAPL